MSIKGAWNQAQLRTFLDQVRIPIRIGAIGRSGIPNVVSLWYYYADGAFWCALHKDARLLSMLKDQPQVGFEVARDKPPYRGVRGQATAQLIPEHGPVILDYLITRYLGSDTSELAQWLLSRKDEEVAVRLLPTRMSTWDYTDRMKGISFPEAL